MVGGCILDMWVWGEVEEHKGVFTIFTLIPWYICDFSVWINPKKGQFGYIFTVCFVVIFVMYRTCDSLRLITFDNFV